MIHHSWTRFRLHLADYRSAKALGLELHGYRSRVCRSLGMLAGAVVLSASVAWFTVSAIARLIVAAVGGA